MMPVPQAGEPNQQNNHTMSKKQHHIHPNAQIWIVLIASIGIFLIGIVQFAYQNELLIDTPVETGQPVQTDYSPAPTAPPIPDTQSGAMITDSVTFKENESEILFEHPPVGEYCNGCFSGFPNASVPNVNGAMIRGSYDAPTTADPLEYTLIIGNVVSSPEDYRDVAGEVSESFPEDLRQLTQLEVGESYVLTTEYLPGYTVTRKPDVFHDPLQKTVYQYEMLSDSASEQERSVFPEYTQTEIAIIPYQQDLIFLIYGYAQPEYDLFDEVLQSITVLMIDEESPSLAN